MKKNPATILLTMLLCLAMLLPAAGATAETKSIFMPDYIVDLYNEAVPAFWKTFLKSEIPDNYKEEFTLKFDSQEEDRIYYTNSSSTLLVMFRASDRNSKATEIYFWNSLRNDIRNLPQIVFGWVAVQNKLEGSDKANGMNLMEWLNEDVEDGATLEYADFNAIRNEKAHVFSSFTLTTK